MFVQFLPKHQNTANDKADIMSTGRLFYGFWPAEAKDRFPRICY